MDERTVFITVVGATGFVIYCACVWLTVRFFNRRERLAKWTLIVAIASMPLLYAAGFGPWCRIDRGAESGSIKAVAGLGMYYPVFWLFDNGPAPVQSAVQSYIIWWLE